MNTFFWQLRKTQSTEFEKDIFIYNAVKNLSELIKSRILSSAKEYPNSRSYTFCTYNIWDHYNEKFEKIESDNVFFKILKQTIFSLGDDESFGLRVYLYNDISTENVKTLDLEKSLANGHVTKVEFSWETYEELYKNC
jgi:hypothetical protein